MIDRILGEAGSLARRLEEEAALAWLWGEINQFKRDGVRHEQLHCVAMFAALCYVEAPHYYEALCEDGVVPMVSYSGRLAPRWPIVRRFAFPILDWSSANVLTHLSPLVSVGCGGGYVERLITQMGGEVVATDAHPTDNKYHNGPQWSEVVACDGIEAARRHPGHTLLLSWPEMAEWPLETLTAYEGDVFAYIGEGPGGCCADDAFFDALEAEWCEVSRIDIPRWAGVHDALFIYERRRGGV